MCRGNYADEKYGRNSSHAQELINGAEQLTHHCLHGPLTKIVFAAELQLVSFDEVDRYVLGVTPVRL
jgi:hypothetical protein